MLLVYYVIPWHAYTRRLWSCDGEQINLPSIPPPLQDILRAVQDHIWCLVPSVFHNDVRLCQNTNYAVYAVFSYRITGHVCDRIHPYVFQDMRDSDRLIGNNHRSHQWAGICHRLHYLLVKATSRLTGIDCQLRTTWQWKERCITNFFSIPWISL